MAWNGYGYWSLAWQQIIYISVATLFKYYYTGWVPTLPVDFSPIKRMFGFSSKMLITNMLTVISQNVLTFIFGKLLPISTVGLFTQANKWNTMGSSFISNTMAQVAQPVLASINEEENRQERVFRKMLRFISFVSFPLMFGLALVAHEFILLTVGPKWEQCVPLLQILCLGGAFLPLHVLYQNYIISRGRSDLYLRTVVLQIILQIGITLCLSSFGIIIMVAAFSLLNLCFTLIWHYTMRLIHPLSVFEALKDTLPFAFIAALCMILVYYCTLWTETLWLLFCVRMVLVAIIYLGVMKLLHVKTLEDCLTFIKNSFL
jgi:O-antigen/teichoic acid export membrane protein